MISPDTVEKIKVASDIVEVIGAETKLAKKGRSHVGKCPFHDDPFKAFVVSTKFAIYKCFTCGATGDVVKFVMDYKSIGYSAALDYLAKQKGIEIEYAPDAQAYGFI